MITGFRHLHNLSAWVLLAVLVISVLLFLANTLGKKSLSKLQDKLRLVAVIVSGLQILLGFALYFMLRWHKQFEYISDAGIRFKALEHPLMMFIGIVLIHIGSAKIKKAAEDKKNRTGLVFFGISLILILSRTPWDSLF